MKIVLKEWMRRPKCLMMVILDTIMCIFKMWLDVQGTRMAAEVFDSGGDRDAIIRFIMLLVSGLCVAVIHKWSGSAIHLMYTAEFDYIADKVLHGEFNMFVEFSCSRVISITERLFNIVGVILVLRDMITSIVEVIVVAVSIYNIIPQVTLPVIALWTVSGIILKAIYNMWNRIDNKADALKRVRNAEYDAIVNGFKEVRGFSTEKRHLQYVKSLNSDICSLFVKRNYVSVLITVVYRSIYFVINGLCIAYCLTALQNGTITLAFAMVMYEYMHRIGRPIEMFLDILDDLSNRLSQIDDWEQFVDYKDKYVSNDGNVVLDAFDNAIELENISFNYGSSSDVLSGLNMTIPKGSHIGICGASGGGKTTLMNILMKYYDPSDGKVLIDGVPYDEISTSSLRSKIGIVNQDVYIFNNTILYNVTYGRPSATEAEVIDACKKANIYDFIVAQPEGFNTDVGPKGLKLSGGQKQRIGLARLFLYNPEIILLDEATASLDNESERFVQEAMAMFTDKTVITIAHRLSTIKDSDTIYVINDHHVAEQGTHDELMSIENGIYRCLATK